MKNGCRLRRRRRCCCRSRELVCRGVWRQSHPSLLVSLPVAGGGAVVGLVTEAPVVEAESGRVSGQRRWSGKVLRFVRPRQRWRWLLLLVLVVALLLNVLVIARQGGYQTVLMFSFGRQASQVAVIFMSQQ